MKHLAPSNHFFIIFISAFFLTTVSFAQYNGGNTELSRFPLPKPAIAQSFVAVMPSNAYSGYKTVSDDQGHSYIRVGNFRVQGSPYLFNSNVQGYLFLGQKKGAQVQLAYDTYGQQLEFYRPDNGEVGTKQLNEIDSFYIISDGKAVKENLFFVNARVIDPSKKYFLQQLLDGDKFSLYKLNKSSLQIVNDNYIESDLREFANDQEYFYLEAGKKTLKKFKPNLRSVKNEFTQADISTMLTDEELSADTDQALKKFFTYLNLK